MLRSRMFTPGFRLYAGIATFAYLAALLYGWGSNAAADGLLARATGPLTFGWKGPVGEHFGYTVLMGLFMSAAFVAGLIVAFRDADAEAEAQAVHVETVPTTRAPTDSSYVPLGLGLAAAVTAVGFASSTAMVWAGVAGLAMVTGAWVARAWSERATGDDETNRELYHRIIDPLRLPIGALAITAFIAIGLSRVLLAVSKTGAVVVFSLVAVVVFVILALLASRPNVSRSALGGLLVLGTVAVLAMGIAGIAAGERDFSHGGGHSGSGEVKQEDGDELVPASEGETMNPEGGEPE